MQDIEITTVSHTVSQILCSNNTNVTKSQI